MVSNISNRLLLGLQKGMKVSERMAVPSETDQIIIGSYHNIWGVA